MNVNRGHILWMVLLALALSSVMAIQMMHMVQDNDEQFAVQLAALRAELVAKSYVDRTLVMLKYRGTRCDSVQRKSLSKKHLFYRYSCRLESLKCHPDELVEHMVMRVNAVVKCGLRSCQSTGCLRVTQSASGYLELKE